MPIAFQCDCGRTLRVKDEFAGRKARCPACGAGVPIPVPEMDVEVEEETSTVSITESPKARTKPPPKSEESDDTYITEKPARLPKPPRKSDESDDAYLTERPVRLPNAPPIEKPRRERPRKRSKRDVGSWIPSISISPTIITGLLMMLGAVVWFIAGLAVGFIFFYPPVLFVLGMAAVIRGVMGRED